MARLIFRDLELITNTNSQGIKTYNIKTNRGSIYTKNRWQAYSFLNQRGLCDDHKIVLDDKQLKKFIRQVEND